MPVTLNECRYSSQVIDLKILDVTGAQANADIDNVIGKSCVLPELNDAPAYRGQYHWRDGITVFVGPDSKVEAVTNTLWLWAKSAAIRDKFENFQYSASQDPEKVKSANHDIAPADKDADGLPKVDLTGLNYDVVMNTKEEDGFVFTFRQLKARSGQTHYVAAIDDTYVEIINLIADRESMNKAGADFYIYEGRIKEADFE